MALIAWYKLDGNADDSSDNGYNGTIIGTPTLENGKIAQCYKFNYSTANGISIPTNFSGLSEYTISAWIKPIGNHYHYNGTVLSSGNWNGTCWAFGVSQDNTQIDVAGRGYNKWISYNLILNTWTHILSYVKNNVSYLYVNGNYIGSRSVTGLLSSDASNTCIGRETYASGYFGFNGSIDDVRVYDHALTDFEIQEIARAKILHYTFDDMQEPTTNQANTDTARTLLNHSSSTGTTMTLSDAPEKGPGWKKVVITARSTSNHRLAQFPYIKHPINTTKTYSLEFDFGTTSGYYWKIDGYTSGGTASTVGNKYSVVFSTTNGTGNLALFLAHKTLGATGINDTIYYRYYQVEVKPYATEFTEGTRTGRVNDYSGFFNHSYPLTETTTPRWTPEAKIGTGAYKFTGTNPISTNQLFFDDLNQEWTVCGWYWLEDYLPANQKLNNFNRGNHISFAGSGNGKALLYGNSGVNDHYTYSSSAVPLQQWAHIAFVYRTSDRTCKIYINGQLDASSRNWGETDIPSGFPSITKFGENFSGYLDDIRVYATALSDADILDLYEARAEIEESGVLYARDFLSNAEETVNLLSGQNVTFVSLSVNMSSQNLGNGKYRITSTSLKPSQVNGTFRMNIPTGILIDGLTYNVSLKYRIITGTDVYFSSSDWCDRPITRKSVNFGEYIFETAYGFRTSYDNTFRFMDYKLSPDTVIEMWDIQLEQRAGGTPFVSTYRPASQLPSTIEFGANEVHETGTANFEDFSTVGITDGLIGYWPLDRNTRDYSGLNRNGTSSGAILNGGSYYFDGVDDTISFGTGNTFFPLLTHTISLMFKSNGVTETTGTSPGLFGFTYGIRAVLGTNGNLTYSLYKTNGVSYARANDGYNYHDSQWHMMTATCDGTSISLYIDGNFKSTADVSSFWDGYTSWPTNRWNLGRDNNSSNLFFRGNMRELKIFNRPLTAEEIAIEYNTMFNNEVQIHESGVLYAKDLRQY